MTGNGYVVLMPQQGCEPSSAEVEAALVAAGWARWDGNGPPAFAVLHNGSAKGDYFEAGYWADRGAKIFFVGGGSRCFKRKHLMGRFGGWSVVGGDNRCRVEDLAACVGRWKEEVT